MGLYKKFFLIHLKSHMTYRSSFFFLCLGRLLLIGNLFLSVYFLLDRFGTVQGYTLPQLMLCCAVVLLSSSLAECFGRGFDRFSRILSTAQFDRILVRPRSIVFQVLCQDMKLSMLPGLLQAAVMLAWAIYGGAVVWTPYKVLVLALMVLCGAAMFFGVYLLYAAVCFFTLEGLEIFNILSDMPREFGKYPYGVYGKGVLWLLTFLLPFALTQHWPLQVLLDRAPAWYGLLPLAALLFLLPCALLWHLGVRHYTSTGS
jgi:ABC-2 type transport system permease protein